MTLKRLLNHSEELTDERLRAVCQRNSARVMPKVRVADVLKIESSGISDEQYRFALTSHFDFVVTDDQLMPLFAVEFDGPSHSSDEQRRRDSLKNKLCESFKLPLLRVNGRYLERKYRGLDLLTWFIEVWFIERMLYQAQEDGRFPEDEPVMASLAYSISGYDNRFPLWLSCEPLARIRRLHEEGKCRGRTPSVIVGVDENVLTALSHGSALRHRKASSYAPACVHNNFRSFSARRSRRSRAFRSTRRCFNT